MKLFNRLKRKIKYDTAIKDGLPTNRLQQGNALKNLRVLLSFLALTFYHHTTAQQYDPGSGNTLMLIGQTFQDEYQGFINGTGLTPAGSSHYATFYLGQIEQGDDDPNAAFLDWVRNNNLGEYALVALSFKDNTAAGGYGQMVNNSGAGFNPDAIHEALIDVTNGAWDSQIDSFAQIMSSRSDTNFLLRIGYEVSLLLFAYQGSQYVNDWLNQQANAGINVFENPDSIPDLDRQAYINAYNYVAQRINGQASNVDFIYHPVRGFNDTQWLYPGSQWVDWFAFSIFNNDVCLEVNGTFNCQGQSIDPNLQQSMQFAQNQGKPIMIAEAAAQNPAASSSGGFNDYLNRLHNVIQSFDVRALAYINSNWPIHGWGPEWGDSRVEVNSAVLNNFQNTYGNGTRYIYSTGGGSSSSSSSSGSSSSGGGSNVIESLNFENGVEDWTQVSGFDTHDWTVESGGTPSSSTGPSGAQEGSQYAYIETSSCCANSSGDNARLVSPTLSGDNRNLSFYYHMYGGNIGTLNVDVSVNGSWQNAVWSISGQQQSSNGAAWTQANVDLSSYSGNIRVRFRAVAAGGWQGDIAIDNIVITGGSGGSSSSSSGGGSSSGSSSSGGGSSSGSSSSGGGNCPATHPLWSSACQRCFESQAQADSAGCPIDGGSSSSSSGGGSSSSSSSGGGGTSTLESLDFESGVEDWEQVSGFDTHDWTINAGGTPSSSTGPSGAQQGSSYAYLETSSCCANTSGNNARLNSPAISGSNRSLTFFYHMYGGNIGTLYVDVNEDGTGWVNDIWSVSGQQQTSNGAAWSQANVDLSTFTGSIRVRFRAEAVGGWQGDIAIDNIQVTGNTSGGGSSSSSSGGGSSSSSSGGGSSSSSSGGSPGGALVPSDGRTMMIIGQDLASATNYVNSGNFPTPSGITTYIAFYNILDASQGYGAIGIDNNNNPVGQAGDLDWGGGPLNAYSAAVAWPNSTLQIGLNIAEGNNGTIWCGGCLAQLANGQRDGEIQKLAAFLNAISGTPVYLRVGYEFDGTWNDGYANRQTYINAYRRVVDVLRSNGVSNTAYVWQSAASPIDDILEGNRENIGDWYPGDNYVDWIGISWFLLPNENPPVGGNPATQLSLADEVLNFSRGRNKPVMIAEATPQGYDIGSGQNCNISPVWDGPAAQGCVGKSANAIWNEWFSPFFSYIRNNSDVIKAVSYINANWNSQGLWDPPYEQGYWGDTRVEANGTITNNWNNELNDSSFWIHGSGTLFQTLGL